MSKQILKVKNISKGSVGLAGSAGWPVVQLSPGGEHDFEGDSIASYQRSILAMQEHGAISVDGKEAKPSPKDLESSLIKEEAKEQSIMNEPAQEVSESVQDEAKPAKKAKK